MYNAAGEPITIKTSGAGPQFAYTYDPQGNPTGIADPAGTHSYHYDRLNRLTEAANPGAAAESYAYDVAGNRMLSAAGAYKYDAFGQVIAGEGFTFNYD